MMIQLKTSETLVLTNNMIEHVAMLLLMKSNGWEKEAMTHRLTDDG
jgi:hypothetical protein